MERSRLLRFAILAAVCLAAQPPTADAAIVISGDVDPADVGGWKSNRSAYVGKTTAGELEINGGSNLASNDGYLGYENTATGVVTVDGAGSTWTNSRDFYVGYEGSGTLNISGDGTVSAGRSTCVACQTGSTGSIHFGPGGGTLTTGSLFASPTQLTGTGTIHTRGLVSDVDLVFDSAASLTQTRMALPLVA
ncbi:MAG: hypothetical protein HQ567_07515 [Candidatus Nealsonbacteria bacterium]|nr:hypothetical protein [Candidatus Nealsonbacteria bacterium]